MVAQWAIPEIRVNPLKKRQTYFVLKIVNSRAQILTFKKMGILKIVLKNGHSQFFMSKIVKLKNGNFIFSTKND